MSNKMMFGLTLILLLVILSIEPALAGPGGKIARAVFESFWGKVALVLLAIIFFPLIAYTIIKEWRAERRTRKDLLFMAQYDAIFDWLQIQQRVKTCFRRIHSAWQDEQLADVCEWMTDWYWQNQQMVFLDRWKKQGLVNICNVKKICSIKPLFFSHRNQGAEHQNSMLVVSITANMQDYLKKRDTNIIIEGSKKYKEVETIWSFTLIDGAWKVSDIEEGTMSLDYVKLIKDLPPIESTVVSDLRA